MRAMDYPIGEGEGDENKVWFIIGAIVGILKMLDIYLLTNSYVVVLIKVFFTAVIGGAGGVLGKFLITYGMKKWKERFNKNKKQ